MTSLKTIYKLFTSAYIIKYQGKEMVITNRQISQT